MAKRLFPKEARRLLGKNQDKELAERFGIAARTVYRERKRLGIGKPPRAKPLTAPQKRRALQFDTVHAASQALGLSDRVLRDLFKKNGRQTTRPKPPEIPPAALKMLGKKRDTEIGAEFGIAAARIRLARTKRGIPSFRDSHLATVTKRMMRVLQTKTVVEAAEILGSKPHYITRLRSRLGIRTRKPTLTKLQISDATRLSPKDYARKHNVELKTALSRRARFRRTGIKVL